MSLRARNLAALWTNYSNVGARLAVVVGCVSTRAEARLYEQAVPTATISWCQLRVNDAELIRRIVSRRDGGSWAQPGDPLRDRSEDELFAVASKAIAAGSLIDRNGIGVRVDVDDLDVASAAEHVLKLLWPTRVSTNSD